MQDCHPDYFSILVTNNYIVIGYLAVGCLTWLLKVDIECVGLRVVRRPQQLARRPRQRRKQLQILFNACYGHSCFLLSNDLIRRVRKAVITKPSSPNSRYTTTTYLPNSSSRTASNSPSPPATTRIGLLIVSRTSKMQPCHFAVLIGNMIPSLFRQPNRNSI